MTYIYSSCELPNIKFVTTWNNIKHITNMSTTCPHNHFFFFFACINANSSSIDLLWYLSGDWSMLLTASKNDFPLSSPSASDNPRLNDEVHVVLTHEQLVISTNVALSTVLSLHCNVTFIFLVLVGWQHLQPSVTILPFAVALDLHIPSQLVCL